MSFARSFVRMLLIVATAALALPSASAATTAVNEVPSQEQVDQAIAALKSGQAQIVELKKESPSWFTPELQQRVQEEGVVPLAADGPDAPLPGEVGIRPGSLMISPFICTMNYIFRKGDTLAIGTAGHCLEANEPVTLLTLAPTGGNPVLVDLGRVLLKRDGGIGADYGLVEVPPERHEWVFPTIAGVAGPCGVYDGGDPQPVAHYGHGLVVGTGGTPRVGMGLEVDDPFRPSLELEWDNNSYAWAGAAMPGDSGSPVRIGQLPAVGNLTHGIDLAGVVPVPFLAWGTRITTVSGWTLVNSPLCPPGDTGGGDTGGDTGGGNGKGNGKGHGKGGSKK